MTRGVGWGEQVKLINKKFHTHTRPDTRSGEAGAAPALGGPPPACEGEDRKSRPDPSQCPTCPHWGLLEGPSCWHLNEKVNIEPKTWGVAGCGVAESPAGKSLPRTSLALPGSARGDGAPRLLGENGLGVGVCRRVFSLSPLAESGGLP